MNKGPIALRVLANSLVLAGGYCLWRLADVVTDLLHDADLLPLTFLAVLALGVTAIEHGVQHLKDQFFIQ